MRNAMVPVPNTGLSQLLHEGSGVGQRALSCGRGLLLDYDNAYLTWKRWRFNSCTYHIRSDQGFVWYLT
jgi:hypothetical protein